MGFLFLMLGLGLLGIGAFLPKDVNGSSLKGTKKGMKIFGTVGLAAWLFFSSLYSVPTGYVGIVTQFGAIKSTLAAGPHIITPFIQDVELTEVRTQRVDAENLSAASKDLQIVHSSISTNFHIEESEAGALYRKVGRDFQKRVIVPAQQESLKAVTARYTAEELVRLREQVKEEVQTMVTDRLRPYSIIVEKNGLSITNFEFSQEFNQAIERKQVAQQDAEQQKYALQKAKLEAETAVTTAKGKAEAARINAEALETKGGEKLLTEKLIEAWKAGGSQVPLIISGGNTSSPLFINLDKLKLDKEQK